MKTVGEKEDVAVRKEMTIMLMSPGVFSLFPPKPLCLSIDNGNHVERTEADHDIAIGQRSAGVGVSKLAPGAEGAELIPL